MISFGRFNSKNTLADFLPSLFHIFRLHISRSDFFTYSISKNVLTIQTFANGINDAKRRLRSLSLNSVGMNEVELNMMRLFADSRSARKKRTYAIRLPSALPWIRLFGTVHSA